MLTITLVLVIFVVFANMYFLAHYAHYADSFFGLSTAAKAILVSFPSPHSPFQVLGYFLVEALLLGLALDVQNTREKTNMDMRVYWYVIMMT